MRLAGRNWPDVVSEAAGTALAALVAAGALHEADATVIGAGLHRPRDPVTVRLAAERAAVCRVTWPVGDAERALAVALAGPAWDREGWWEAVCLAADERHALLVGGWAGYEAWHGPCSEPARAWERQLAHLDQVLDALAEEATR